MTKLDMAGQAIEQSVDQTTIQSSHSHSLTSFLVDPIYQSIKTLIDLCLFPLNNQSNNQSVDRTVLLIGESGLGKSTFIHRICEQTINQSNHHTINLSIIDGSPMLLTDESINQTIKQSIKNQPSIILIENIDHFFPFDDQSNDQSNNLLRTLLKGISRLSESDRVFIIGTSNNPSLNQSVDQTIHPIIKKVFTNQFHIDLPTKTHRQKIFEVCLAPVINQSTDQTTNQTVDQSVEESVKQLNDVVAQINEHCSGVTGADIQSIVRRAVHHSINQPIHQPTDQSNSQLNEHSHSLSDGQSLTHSTTQSIPSFDDFMVGLRAHNQSKVNHSAGKPNNQTNNTSINQSIKQSITWDDIIGLTEAKNRMKEIIELMTYQPNNQSNNQSINQSINQFRPHMPTGVLLYGPPGSGKTLIAQCLFSLSNNQSTNQSNNQTIKTISLPMSQILSKYHGVAEQTINQTINQAISQAPCLIFIDEIDAVFGSNNQSNNQSNDQSSNQTLNRRLISTLATCMDRLSELNNQSNNQSNNQPVIIVGATNLPFLIDKSLIQTNRFDCLIDCLMPNTEEKRLLIDRLIERRGFIIQSSDQSINQSINQSIDQSINQSINQMIEQYSDGFSPADVKHWINMTIHTQQARLESNNQSNNQTVDQSNNQSNNQSVLLLDDFITARSKVSRSCTQEMLDRLKNWNGHMLI